MNSIMHVMTQLCTAAAEGAQKTYDGLEGIMEVVAVVLSRFQNSLSEQMAARATAAAVQVESPVAPLTPPGTAQEVVASGFYARIGAFADSAFAPIFHPMNQFLARFYEPWAQIVVVMFFVATWVWVAFILDERYVNLSCPYKTKLADLRIWTLIAMAPTLFVYLYFR